MDDPDIKVSAKDLWPQGTCSEQELVTTTKRMYEYIESQVKAAEAKMAAEHSMDFWRDAQRWFWRRSFARKSQFLAARDYMGAIQARKAFLLNMDQGARVASRIMQAVLNKDKSNKVLIFSERTPQIDKITQNTVHSNKVKGKKKQEDLKHLNESA